jgi:hypothetical protein
MVGRWNFEAEYLQSCNCSYGCPCNFNALPTSGNCEALIGWRIRSGRYGDTALDGVTFAWGLSWPKAIHMGNGAGRVYIDRKASAAQRKAVEEITSGKRGGGVFAVFPSTFSRAYPMKIAEIDFRFKEHDSSFSVKGVGAVQSEHIRNPVTGVPFEAQIILPGGINMKKANVTNIRRWWLRDEAAGWNMAYENASGFFAVQKYNEKGPLKRSA